MISPNEQIELVYMVPYLGEVSPQVGRNRVLQYRKLNGDVDTHKRSPDKEKYQHCYDHLVAGRNYIVVTRSVRTTRGGRNRWVYIDYYEIANAEMAQMIVDRVRVIDAGSGNIPLGYKTTMGVFTRAAQEVVQVWKVRESMRRTKQLVDELLQMD